MKTTTLLKLPLLLLYAGFLILISCNDNQETTDPHTEEPLITEKGEVTGSIVSSVIGQSGGTIQSVDALFTLTIPESALSSETEISIQPISNEAPLGLGQGYRLLPEGTTFAEPVTLTFHYTNELLQDALPDFLWIVTQAADGSWNALLKSEVDKNSKTVTIKTNHFSDWALGRFIDFTLNPSSKTIKKEQSVQLKLSGFSRDSEIDEDMELVPLVPIEGDGDGLTPLTPIPSIESRLMDFRVKQWTLNGVAAPVSNGNGSLTVSGTNANYTAPNKLPDINPVAVTVELEANNKEGGKAAYMVTSNISVIESDYFLFVTIDGQKHEYYQYGFNGTVPPDPNNFGLVNCGLTDGDLGIAGSTISNGSDFVNGFALVFENPAETTRNLIGFNEDGNDEITFQFADYSVYTLDFTEYTYDAEHEICNTENKCGSISVTIIDYNMETSRVTGYFSGTIYEESTNTNWEQCQTPDQHHIEGEFNLFVVNM